MYVQPDVCNGCGYCVVGCPFGVIDRRPDDGRAFKCTFCYDRQKVGLQPACATACPTESILFGDIDELRARADARVETAACQGRRRRGRCTIRARRASAASTRCSSSAATRPHTTCRRIRRCRRCICATAGDRRQPPRSRLLPAPRGVRGSPMTVTYYDVPLLIRPVWTWEVPLYFFVGGAAGGAAIIGTVADWTWNRRHARARREMDRGGRRPALGGAAHSRSRAARALHEHAARFQAAERDVGGLLDAHRIFRQLDGGSRAVGVHRGGAGKRRAWRRDDHVHRRPHRCHGDSRLEPERASCCRSISRRPGSHRRPRFLR